MRFSEETLDQVRQAVDLADLIGAHVQLRKVGQTWKGLCPFHAEKTPSFTVNPDRQAYHCFGCGAGGDAIRFVMETEKLPFVDAVESLAERYGVTLPKLEKDDRSGAIHRALEDAATFYRRALEDPETGQAARAYLAGRGLAGPTSQEFRVGWAPPGWDALSSRLVPVHGVAALLEAGLVLRREKGEGVYDRFRGRVVVPLVSPSGKVVGFGGRGLGDETPKYLNSPETPVYRKGKFLFGLDRARQAFKGKDEAVLVEGYFDVMALVQAGVTETVATAGTALTIDQCRVLKRYVPKVLLVFDGDAAGQAAAEKALFPALGAGLSVRLATLPPGEDPDTLVRGEGRTAWERVIGSAKRPAAFLAARHAGDREAALRVIARLGASMDDPIAARLLVEEGARALSFDEAALAREVERVKSGGRARGPAPATGAAPTRRDDGGSAPGPAAGSRAVAGRNAVALHDAATRALETGVLALLVAHPELRDEAAERVRAEWFVTPECRTIADALLRADGPAPEALLSEPELADGARAVLSGLLAEPVALAEPHWALGDAAARLERRALEAERKLLQAELRGALSEGGRAAEVSKLQVRIQETAAALRALASEARRKERA